MMKILMVIVFAYWDSADVIKIFINYVQLNFKQYFIISTILLQVFEMFLILWSTAFYNDSTLFCIVNSILVL